MPTPVPASTTTNPDGTTNTIPATPGYDNTGKGNAQVRDLTMNGTSPTQRSVLRLIVGRLDVFGDFNNPQQSFVQRAGSTISFKSQGNQTISGNTNGFTNVEIDGSSSSIKTLTNIFSIKAGGSLKFINGILQTDISRIDTNYIIFDASSIEANGTITPAGRIVDETNTSNLRGYAITTQGAAPGITQDFSNLGFSLTFAGNDPGPVFVSRNTAGNYAPTAFGGGDPKPGIRRVFAVAPNNPAANSGGLNATVQFAYFDNELTDLRVNTTNPPDYSGSVDKSKLALYVSTTGGNTFSQLGRDSNNNNLLVKAGVTTFATFTLSEQQTPLPVKLISFDAKRTGSNALITWATAVEISNSGFEVQVSTDGTTFRKLAFVASQAINSTGILKYSFLDEENGKTGARYYRLRQIDEDGKDDFSPVRVVSFSAASIAQATTLTAYPNPFNANDLPVVLVQATTVGDATLQVIDMMGRVITRQSFTTAAGIQEVNISQASNLSSGVYMAKVTLATGEVKTIRIQKR
ncbi:MAG: T9SS type A sorting domain-containing protein [Hymenobacter sp.]|nr:MAG: T9SS type A sorting domain-containing protein [Hymenobacter sp.]